MTNETQLDFALFRYDVLGEFMEYIARTAEMESVPAVLVAYLGVLTSLASGPRGAQVMHH